MKRRKPVERQLRLSYAPKVPIGPVVRLYRSDAAGVRDEELLEDVSWRLYARCHDILMIADSKVRCQKCLAEFDVPRGRSAEGIASCPSCGWRVSAAEFWYSRSGTDLDGHNARPVWVEYVSRFPAAESYQQRMLLVDRLIHGIHRSGAPAARNLFESHPRQVLAVLDGLAGAIPAAPSSQETRTPPHPAPGALAPCPTTDQRTAGPATDD